MKTFPMFLKMENRHVVIVGGGEQAAQKCRLMLKTEAEVRLVAQVLEPELADYAKAGRINHVPVSAGLFSEAVLVFVATECKGADAAWASIAKDQGAVVNVVDYPDLCDAYTPSIVDRDPVVVAIGTEGTAPVLGRQIKSKIEQFLEPNLGQFARVCGDFRGRVAATISPSQRRLFWRWVFGGAPRALFASGSEREGVSVLKKAIESGDWARSGGPSLVHTIRADWRKPDLISILDARHLQEADIVVYDDPSLETVLEFARRDAMRRLIDPNAGDELRKAREKAAEEGQNLVILSQKASASVVVNILQDGAPKVAV